MRSPQRHSNMWMISPVSLFITVRTSSSFPPQRRQRLVELVEEFSTSATFSAWNSSTAHPIQVRHAICKMDALFGKILSGRKRPRGPFAVLSGTGFRQTRSPQGGDVGQGELLCPTLSQHPEPAVPTLVGPVRTLEVETPVANQRKSRPVEVRAPKRLEGVLKQGYPASWTWRALVPDLTSSSSVKLNRRV
jgi:hypothetical protein